MPKMNAEITGIHFVALSPLLKGVSLLNVKNHYRGVLTHQKKSNENQVLPPRSSCHPAVCSLGSLYGPLPCSRTSCWASK